MSTPSPTNNVQVGSVSDRGLSEKRPLNEDSYLADAARGIFVVADGVGGAEAGEVASQTAVDVLNDAFRQKVADGEDVEDLMELAIQRANSSIHQMAQDHARFSMMATTVVALHLDGHRATIGHVGDSRLYRLTPDGNLRRETEDHSIVEEEVRAGRMTPEQAANHPSKNVISRALGAEESVEADMKVLEVEDGSAFLLCTDGITRHIPDGELRELLTSEGTPAQLCEEMKRRCYQRGAEDNLTAVVVQVGAPKFERHPIEDESTVSFEMEPTEIPSAPIPVAADNSPRLTPASRVAFPAPSPVEQIPAAAVAPAAARRGRGLFRFIIFLFVVVAVAGAFYGGMIYQRQQHVNLAITNAQPTPSPQSAFTDKRVAVDADPQKWITDNVQPQLTKESVTNPVDSKDAEFLYLYGRALTQTGDHRGASEAFQAAINNLRSESKTSLSLDSEVKLADAAATLKLNKTSATPHSQQTAMAEDKAIRILDETLGLKREAPPK
jgi:serine/threonine protein phosphatase PrpC